ncbi:uncharacterized protein B0H18DRAFT_1021975, partial [Fomitopsis serialis]|uniref:uncharacterized protein n=1 Tax=Fomitopsis serialis TaxID=139415 RepID=UPI0020072BC0
PPPSPPQPSTHALLVRKVYRISSIVRNPKAMVPSPMLSRSGIDPAILARDWDAFSRHLAKRGITIPEVDVLRRQDTSGRPQPPTWVVLYALCYKVERQSDAWKALVLAFFHLPVVPVHLRPAVLILMSCWLAEHDLLVPLQRLVDSFLEREYETELQDFHFQLLLQLIAYASLSSQVFPIVRHLNQSTYDALLGSPSALPTTGLIVSRKMKAQGFSPTMQHLARLMLLARTILRLMNGEKISPDGLLRLVSSLEALHADAMPPESDIAEGEPDPNVYHVGTTADGNLPTTSGAHKQDLRGKPLGDITPLLKTASVWKSTVMVASRDLTTSSEYLRQVYDRAVHVQPQLRLDEHLHVIAILGFLRRRDHTNALEVWDKMRQYQPRMTKLTLTVGAQALTLAGQPMRALDLLFDATELQASSEEREGTPLSLIDTQTVNIFMVSLRRIGFTDAIFVLWDNMDTMFDVRPDLYTVVILLKTARLASKCNPSFRKDDTDSDELARNSCFSQLETTMNAEATRGSSGLWNGERAGAVALHLAQDIIFSNWPALKEVQSPAEALRPTGDFQGSFPMTSLLRTVLHRTAPPTAPSPEAQSASAARVALPYPQILLNDVAFRTYIDLLASESQIPQIPLALAWMRALDIKPSKNTLATALLYWAEVGMDAPLFEHFRDGSSQYARLKRWMGEWVGERLMPTDKHIAMHMRRLKYFKEHRRRPRLDPQS